MNSENVSMPAGSSQVGSSGVDAKAHPPAAQMSSWVRPVTQMDDDHASEPVHPPFGIPPDEAFLFLIPLGLLVVAIVVGTAIALGS